MTSCRKFSWNRNHIQDNEFLQQNETYFCIYNDVYCLHKICIAKTEKQTNLGNGESYFNITLEINFVFHQFMHFWLRTSSHVFNETLQFNTQIYVVSRNCTWWELVKIKFLKNWKTLNQNPNNKSIKPEYIPPVV